MLSLQTFEEEINAAMLLKGKQYYEHGMVTELEELDDKHWSAEVEGSEIYHVEVILANQDKLLEHSCDCPYGGTPCKHQIAVFFALRDELGKKKAKSTSGTKKDMFKSLLQAISLKEYQDFVANYAAKNKNFKTEFELFFAEKDNRIDVGGKYAGLVRKIINKHAYHGFIEYHSSWSFATDVNNLADAGSSYISKQNFKDGFAVAKALLPPVIMALMSSDDSNGSIGDCINNIIELLQQIAESGIAAIELKEQLLSFLQSELSDNTYFDYGDFGYYLLDIFQSLAIRLSRTDIYIEYIDGKLKNTKFDGYRFGDFVQRKLAVLEMTGRSEEAERIIQQHMDLPNVRRVEVGKAIDNKDFASAKKMIEEGIKVAKHKEHPGTVKDWQKQLLEIAVKEKDLETVRTYARQFAFDPWFSVDYYKHWKKTYSPGQWKVLINKHIEETIDGLTSKWKKEKYLRLPHPPLLQALAPVYIQEHYWERLLQLVQQANDLVTTLNYHEYLVKHYPKELLAIYLPALEVYGNRASDRRGYADLVQKMRIIMKSLPEGKEKILTVAQKLITAYSVKPRRPAMIEELDKLLKG